MSGAARRHERLPGWVPRRACTPTATITCLLLRSSIASPAHATASHARTGRMRRRPQRGSERRARVPPRAQRRGQARPATLAVRARRNGGPPAAAVPARTDVQRRQVRAPLTHRPGTPCVRRPAGHSSFTVAMRCVGWCVSYRAFQLLAEDLEWRQSWDVATLREKK